MEDVQTSDVLNALKNVMDPDLHRDIVSLGFVKDIDINNSVVSVTIELTTPACPFKQKMMEQAECLIRELPGVKETKIIMTSKVRGKDGPTTRYLSEVKNVIVVASGKGGVGKSTVSTNIALALARMGAKVGLMDADIYGPSIPLLMGIKDAKVEGDNDIMFPIHRYGINVFSMGFFLPTEKAAIWRGPMLDKVITQFISEVRWSCLDYLVVDLPPGTGDVQLCLCQKLNLTGAVIVSTPQDAALNIAQKAISMFHELQCPILGIVENMSYYICPQCGQKDYIFGQGNIQQYCQSHDIPLLGQIPLTSSIRLQSDQGNPIILSSPESQEAQTFFSIAQQLASKVSIKNMQEN